MPGAPTGRDWIALTDEVLPVDAALAFAGDPSCGAVALFLGVVRDESPGRPGVHLVEYEAWQEQVEPVLAAVVAAARARHPEIARVAVLHRTGPLWVGEASVLVCVSSPHRAAAFEAARFCIDTLKETAPIWKDEHWEGGHAFGLDAKPIAPVEAPAGDAAATGAPDEGAA